MHPVEDAEDAERNLHAALMAEPRRRVAQGELAAIGDPDARHNYEVVLKFRDRLLEAGTVEACYASTFKGKVDTPPLFIEQMAHVILRNILDGCDDAFVLRAAELFFRPQRVTLHEGALLAADEERIAGSNPAPVSPLVSMLGLEKSADIDVLADANAQAYFERSDAYDMALDLTAGRRGLAALAQVIARWVRHLLAVEADVEPLVELRDAPLSWYVGLDAEGTRIGDRLWRSEELDEATQARVAGLFRLNFPDRSVVAENVAGEPVYVIMAMTPEKVLRLKPQNLVAGLPVTHREAVS